MEHHTPENNISLKFEVRLGVTSDGSCTYIEYSRYGVEHRSEGLPSTIFTDGDMYWYEYNIMQKWSFIP